MIRTAHGPVALMSALALALSTMAACGPPEAKSSSLAVMVERAREAEDQNKRKTIEAAVSMYVVEHGRNPDSTQDLVDAGYLTPEAIRGRDGRPMGFSPEDVGGATVISKSCGACGKGVASSSQVGDICPHCGVRWGYETNI